MIVNSRELTPNESLTKGLEEALAYVRGNTTGVHVREITLPDIDVVAIRRNTGLSQLEFARSIGVAKGTLVNWEHGRRQPTGPAQVLLSLIARRPSVVQELLT